MRSERRRHVASMSDDARAKALSSAAHNVMQVIWPEARLGSYAPTTYEIDPGPCEVRQHEPAALPWFADRTPNMIFRACGPLVAGPWGLPQPDDDCEEIEPDVLIVPLLAATAAGDRLGQGGGHYDRYLERRTKAGTRPRTIGLAWDCQLVDSLPTEPWDVPLDFLATPSRLYGAP
ncbi:5-formyltetrahydrofolate cyclo-ligase [Pacificimonas flava]|uniref:5-formyltetrahydrofolate cyclo-ligase n=3 Tax=Sphingosinicellaceae TaxID=2820280 RepID=A0A219B761_9SPHN|nr:5-formyltetrahydrofolate cyclo-ligase [Pacificimonas aurantium]OWV33983.1 5-formyltetrahydrofolate cyclo-ligase [Pacificimonas flava]